MADNFLVRGANLLGQVAGSFIKARDGIALSKGKSPNFVAGLTQASGDWNGGRLSDTDAAQRRAVRNSWFFTGVNIKALDLAASKLDLFVNTGMEEDGGEKAIGHPFYSLLKRPNKYMGASMMMQYTEWWLELQGEAFWFLEPGKSGGLNGLWALPSNSMDIEFTEDNKDIKSFVLKLSNWYYLDPKYICYFRLPNPFDFWRGMSPIVSRMMSVDSDNAMRYWNGAFFGKDNVMPSSVISLGSGTEEPYPMEQVDAITEELREEYQAIKRKTIITNANSMAVAMLGYNAKDMDFLAGMGWNKGEILWGLGVPEGMVDKNSTEANATVGKAVFKDNMWGLKNLIADEITSQILIPHYSEELEAKFEDDRWVDRDLKLREAALAKDAMPREAWAKKYFGVTLTEGEATMNEAKAEKEREAKASQFGNSVKPTSNAVAQGENKKPVAKNLKGGIGSGESEWLYNGATNEIMDTKSIQQELNSLQRKAANYFKQGRIAEMKFFSNVLDEETVKSILLNLSGAEQKSDLGEIFAHWEYNLSTGNTKAISWRPWSSFEFDLINAVRLALANILATLLDNVSDIMGQDASLWDKINKAFETTVRPVWLRIAKQAAEDVGNQLGKSEMTISLEMTERRAMDYAVIYDALSLRTDRKAVNDAVTDWRSKNEENGLQGLRERLQNLKDENGVPLYSDERAERIAKSDATSVYAGAKIYALEANGYGKVVYQPRAHIGCRCYVQPARMPDGTKVVAWFTAKDEKVCTQELETPWGIVKGCRELHRTVISEGYAGQKIETNAWKAGE